MFGRVTGNTVSYVLAHEIVFASFQPCLDVMDVRWRLKRRCVGIYVIKCFELLQWNLPKADYNLNIR